MKTGKYIIIEKYKKNKNHIGTITTIVFNFITLVLAVLGLIGFKNDCLFFFIYFIPYVTSTVLLIFIFSFYKRYDKVKVANKETVDFIFSKNLKRVIAQLKDSENNLSNSYNEFGKSVVDINQEAVSSGVIVYNTEIEMSDGIEEVNSSTEIIMESVKDGSVEVNESLKKPYQLFYKDIKKNSDMMFSAVVESLKRTVDHILSISYDGTEIAVCIKQLDSVYKKKGTGIPDELHTFAVFRNKEAYEEGREIGRSYIVNNNVTFRSCIMAKETRTAFYTENEIFKAIESGTYRCENQDELLSHRTYSATMVVPICQNKETEKMYYGFLCIDTKTEKKNIFNPDELLSVMQTYADILATYYHNVNMYFPLIFDYIYHQQKTEN